MAAMVTQLKSIWTGMGRTQRVLVMAAGAGILAVLVFGVVLGGQAEWRLLAAEMDQQDAQKLMSKLEEEKIEFQVNAKRTAIEVPADDLQKARQVAMEVGITTDGKQRGYRMLEGGDYWRDTRDQFEMRVRIAQEQELSNTILGMDGVRSAKVHISPERQSYNRRDTRPAKAAVKVGVRPGRQLSPSQVEAIVQVVSHAVQGLDAEHVVVTDERGMVLTRSNGVARADALRLQNTRAKEQALQESATTALARALGGAEKLSVRVALELDNERIDTTEKILDADGRVITREKVSSSQNSRTSPGGRVSTAGVQSGRSSGGAGGDSKEEDFEADYAHPTKLIHSVREPGRIKRLTVGVLVDETFADRKAEIESVVKGIVGFQEGRDYISVEFFPMARTVEDAGVDPAAVTAASSPTGFMRWLGLGLPLLIGAGCLLWFWRSAASARKDLQRYIDTPTAEERKRIDEKRRQGEASPDPKDDIVRMVDENPDAVGRLLRSWIYEPVKS